MIIWKFFPGFMGTDGSETMVRWSSGTTGIIASLSLSLSGSTNMITTHDDAFFNAGCIETKNKTEFFACTMTFVLISHALRFSCHPTNCSIHPYDLSERRRVLVMMLGRPALSLFVASLVGLMSFFSADLVCCRISGVRARILMGVASLKRRKSALLNAAFKSCWSKIRTEMWSFEHFFSVFWARMSPERRKDDPMARRELLYSHLHICPVWMMKWRVMTISFSMRDGSKQKMKRFFFSIFCNIFEISEKCEKFCFWKFPQGCNGHFQNFWKSVSLFRNFLRTFLSRNISKILEMYLEHFLKFQKSSVAFFPSLSP